MNERLFKKTFNQLDNIIQDRWDDVSMKQMKEGLKNDKNPTFIWEWMSPDTQAGWKLELNYEQFNYDDRLKPSERSLNLFYSWVNYNDEKENALPDMTKDILTSVMEDDTNEIILNIAVKIFRFTVARFNRHIKIDDDLALSYYNNIFRA